MCTLYKLIQYDLAPVGAKGFEYSGIPQNQWVHVGMVRDTNIGGISMYENGILKKQETGFNVQSI